MDNDTMYKELREYKIKNGLPLGDPDPVAEYLGKINEKNNSDS
jgi:hypothetical protein